METICKKCAAPLTAEAAYCVSCGAPVAATTQEKVRLSKEDTWLTLLAPGENPIMVVKGGLLRTPYPVETNPAFDFYRPGYKGGRFSVGFNKNRAKARASGYTYYSALFGFGGWQLIKLDQIVATGQRLLFIRKGKIVNVQWAPGDRRYTLPGAFTIDPLTIAHFNESKEQALQESKAFDEARKEEWRKSNLKGKIRHSFMSTWYRGEFQETSASYLHAGGTDAQNYPPLASAQETKHRLRPRTLGWTRLPFWLACWLLIVNSRFLFGQSSLPVLIIFALLLVSVTPLYRVISLPLRIRRWVGIQLKSEEPWWPVWSSASNFMEVVLSDKTKETQLFQLLSSVLNEVSATEHQAP